MGMRTEHQLVSIPTRQMLVLHPAVLLLCAIGGNSLLQLANRNADWSPFSVFAVHPAPYITLLYACATLAVLGGAALGIFSVFPSKRLDRHLVYQVDLARLDRLSLGAIALTLPLFAATQVSLGSANLLNLWTGQATALDVEEAIKTSPLGIHGLALIAAYGALLIWHAHRLAQHSTMKCKLSLLLATLIFLSQGKAQGVVYLGAAFVLQPQFRKGAGLKFAAIILAILAIFLLTRVARNQDQDLQIGLDLMLLFVFGFYFGSPVANTSYLIEGDTVPVHLSSFFSFLLPQKLLPADDITASLPDPTSPFGVVGSGVLLGGIPQALVYCFLVGFIAAFLYRQGQRHLSIRLFQPFLLVACLFAMMYNHFMNLTFFWIPLVLAFFVSQPFRRKKIVTR